MTEKMLRMPAVQDMVGLSRSTIYDMISKDEFPRPVRVGRRAVAWRSTEVGAWIADRVISQAA